jgi:hypothetical protein
VAATPAAAPEKRSGRKLWWVGVVVGGVAAVGLAVGLGVGLTRTSTAEPYKGNITPGVLSVTP